MRKQKKKTSKKVAKKKYNFKDKVNHPAHYQGRFECIEILEDQFMHRPHEWNAVKYLWRADKKGNDIQDLEKAIWYINRKIALLKGGAPRPNDMAK